MLTIGLAQILVTVSLLEVLLPLLSSEVPTAMALRPLIDSIQGGVPLCPLPHVFAEILAHVALTTVVSRTLGLPCPTPLN